MRHTLLQAGLVVSVALAAWHAIAYGRAFTVRDDDRIGPGLALYRAVRADLPAHGLIGFLPTTDNSTFNAANYFVAQHALAPRIVLSPFDERVGMVVSGVNATPATDRHPQLAGFVLVSVGAGGVRVYRRVP